MWARSPSDLSLRTLIRQLRSSQLIAFMASSLTAGKKLAKNLPAFPFTSYVDCQLSLFNECPSVRGEDRGQAVLDGCGPSGSGRRSAGVRGCAGTAVSDVPGPC